jgi:hypothetical protein
LPCQIDSSTTRILCHGGSTERCHLGPLRSGPDLTAEGFFEEPAWKVNQASIPASPLNVTASEDDTGRLWDSDTEGHEPIRTYNLNTKIIYASISRDRKIVAIAKDGTIVYLDD